VRNRLVVAALLAVATLGLPRDARAAEPSVPERPAEDAFVADGAHLLTPEDAAEVRAIGRRALSEHGVPFVVATIPSMATHGARGWTIEAYAKRVFDAWGLGSPQRNVGILLLVARDDRKARVELGADWGSGHHEYAQSVLDVRVLPRFRRGAFSEGLREGAAGLFSLAALGPGQPAPEEAPAAAAPMRGWLPLLLLGATLLFFVVRTVRSIRHGPSRSWAPRIGPYPYGWGAGGPYLTGGAYGASRGSSGGGFSGSSGGFSGGSFGGGFSGGGGASGSW
jgi:uncharacterized protein